MRTVVALVALALLGALSGTGLSGTGSATAGAPEASRAARTRVELTAVGDPLRLETLLSVLDAEVELRSGDRVQAMVPTSAVVALEQARGVLHVEPPSWVDAFELSAAATLIGADRWQRAGFTGHGVRVAVIDTGFAGTAAAFGPELGDTVHVRAFRSDGVVDGVTEHGRRAAEIVREMAPGAQLYLLSFSTVTELSAAVDYAIAEDVDVISFSVGFIHNGPGDGTGTVANVVERALTAGLLWTSAAGNWAEQHWSGLYRDSNGDGVHEYTSGEVLNGRDFQAGDLITASLRWNDQWGAACADYDLELFAPDGSLVRASRRAQSCSGDPVEGVRVLATQSGRYSVRILSASDQAPRQLDLLLLGSPDRGGALQQFVRERSLPQPADHPGVITVGALASGTNAEMARFSSRGPTTDGREKPEIVSPANAATAGVFAGTSASAPYVAGALALLIEGLPSADAGAVAASLDSRSIELGLAGAPSVALAQLGTLEGLGLLVPAGAEAAAFTGQVPAEGGLALLAYRGPDGYPLRFTHLLLDGTNAVGFFRPNQGIDGGWDRHFPGAPSRVNTFEVLDDGDVVVVRFPREGG